VRSAAFYEVIVWQDGARKLDLWPRSNEIRLPISATAGRASALPEGHYLWFVYPWFGDQRPHAGRLLASGAVRVRA
jgi:hypothetical protein